MKTIDIRNIEEDNPSPTIQKYPLTRGQAALWFHYQIAPQSVAYHLAVPVGMSSNTDLQALERSFQRLSERHPMLRTLFSSQFGKPVQCVQPFIPIAFQVEDASHWTADHLNLHLENEIYRPFDLERGPTWRVTIYRNAPNVAEINVGRVAREHMMLLTLHHIIADLWSIAIIFSEIAALYQEEKAYIPAILKPIRMDYAHLVSLEIDRLASPQAETSWEYWRSYLSGELSPLHLPIDKPRTLVATGRGSIQTISLNQNLTHALRNLAEKEHVALYTVLLTAFQTLLHRYTGQNDILLGFPKAGRSPASIRTIGYFINQTVVRLDFSENPPFSVLLKSVQKSIEEGIQHDWYPFSQLVQHLQPTRDLSQSPLIQAVFSWQQAPRLFSSENVGAFVLGIGDQSVNLGELHLHSVSLPYRCAAFDLMMLAVEMPDGLAVTIEYATELFDSSSIALMADCYRTLLEHIAATPENRVSDLEILPERERTQLVQDWNENKFDFPTGACLHYQFEQQVERTPKTIAVWSDAQELTYNQLNQRANQLAHFLQAEGIGPDILVGVCLEPSVEMVVALLGILKAGGAYLPLDPDFPPDRLTYMLADANPALLLTRQGLRRLFYDDRIPIVCLDGLDNVLGSQSSSNPISSATPEHLIYVIYTSGSTGHPKGAALTHRGVVNLLADFHTRQSIQTGDACSWWTSPSFDVSVYEIFSPLIAGGSLLVIPPEIRLNPAALLDWFQIHRISSSYLPPFLLADFAAWLEIHPGALSLRRLLVGVEPIPHALLAGLCKNLPGLGIINGYGPTETTICSTLYKVDPASSYPGNAPIGRPVANSQVYLLDRHLNLVPIGVIGEIYIGGIGLARGYYNHPELTSEHFIPSPFRSGERLYKTGDLARYLPDGNLIYVGRTDTQVKIHGMRIELGEIETALVQHPQVKQAVAILQEISSGGRTLVAYLVPYETYKPTSEELRHFLNRRLPYAMIPSRFVILDSFPLTPTGKLDRKAIPNSYNVPPKQKHSYRAPQTATESRLTAIWQQVLQLESIGVDDNFFEMGGDSILSLQIVAKAMDAGLQISPRSIFQAPTLAQLAVLADLSVPVQKLWSPEQYGNTVPLTPIQCWFFEQNFPDPNHWNQSLLFVTSRPLEPRHFRFAVSALLGKHAVLRSRFTHAALGWQQTIAGCNDELPCEMVDLSGMADTQQMDAIERQMVSDQCSLNLSKGPLIRVVYFNFGADQPGRLLIIVHHLVMDGISWPILLEDLQVAYQQHDFGLPTRLSPPTTSFQTWALRLTEYAQSADLTQEANFWLHTCEHLDPALSIVGAAHTPPGSSQNTESTAQKISKLLEREETQALLRDTPDAYGTETLDLLLTALTRALQSWTDREFFLVDLEAHGRENIFDDIDLSRTVGWFTALFPVPLHLPKDTGPGQAIKLIKEQVHRIRPHGLGYGLLRYIGPDLDIRDRLKAAPMAPILFNYLGQLYQNNKDSLFPLVKPEFLRYQRSPNGQRPYPIEVNAIIHHGELHIDWIYSSNLHTRQTIEQLANLFLAELRALISHCLSLEAVGYTPCDFPGMGFSQTELDKILQIINPLNGSIARRNLEAIYPLSPMQQGMVFHTLYTPQSGIYFEQTVFRIHGPVDESMFEKAWQQVLNRHAILRTAFVWRGSDPMLQVVFKNTKLQIVWLDWRGISPSDQQSSLERLFTQERERGFNMSTAPLWSLVICQTATDNFQLILNHHHALLDGWSLPLLFQEVFSFYDSFYHAQNLQLPPPPSYQDYITWLNSRDLSTAEDFWRKQLAEYIPISWPNARPSLFPTPGASRPAEIEKRLSMQIMGDLQEFVRRQHITTSTLIQGAWALLLSRYSHREDVVFGMTVSGRPSEIPGSLSMLGLFINTLPLRVRFQPASMLSEWLQQIQRKTMEFQPFDYCSLSKIQVWSGIPHGSSLFNSLLVVENYPTNVNDSENKGILRITDIHAIEQATYPLNVVITPDPQLRLKIIYDPDQFGHTFVDHLLLDLCQVLEKMISHPHSSLSEVFGVIQFHQERDPESQTAVINPLQTEQLHNPANRQPQSDPRTMVASPGNRLEEHLVHLWEKLLKKDQIGIHENFFDLGGDSLVGAVCIYQVHEMLHEPIPLKVIFNSPTVFELSRYLEQAYPRAVARFLGIPIPASSIPEVVIHPRTLVPIQTEGGKLPLFCIHPAGGIVFPYYTLAHFLGKEQPLYGIQDPSQFDTQLSSKSIESMATNYITALKTIQPTGPYNLLGWSVGGVVAYEMAQQLSGQGQSVASLIVLDTSAPHSQPLHPIHSWFQELANFISSERTALHPIVSYIHSGLYLLAVSMKRRNTTPQRKITLLHLLGWAGLDAWRTRLLQEAEVARLIPQEDSLLLLEMPAVRRILELVQEHRNLALQYYAKPYPGRITLFRAVRSTKKENGQDDLTMGWDKLAEERVEVHTISANHVALMVKPYVETLARELEKCLDRSQ